MIIKQPAVTLEVQLLPVIEYLYVSNPKYRYRSELLELLFG